MKWKFMQLVTILCFVVLMGSGARGKAAWLTPWERPWTGMIW